MKAEHLHYWAAFFAALLCSSTCRAVTIDTVPVGNPGNTDVGAVAYAFRMGKYEVTNVQYVEFLNAVDPMGANALGLYNNEMTTSTQGGINFTSGSPAGSNFSVKPPAIRINYRYDDKPVVYVDWFSAIRFANWLHNGQVSGDTETGAYTLLGGTPTPSNANSIERNPGASWWLPSLDEWYKAAYHKNDGVTGNYWLYPTRTDVLPNNNSPANDTGNSANFSYTFGRSNSFPLTDAGAYTQSYGPYGTFDQGGNVWEWNDTLISTIHRGLRGGSWASSSNVVSAFDRRSPVDPTGIPTLEDNRVGFRVAAIIPEPSALVLAVLAGWPALCAVRRSLAMQDARYRRSACRG